MFSSELGTLDTSGMETDVLLIGWWGHCQGISITIELGAMSVFCLFTYHLNCMFQPSTMSLGIFWAFHRSTPKATAPIYCKRSISNSKKQMSQIP
jgi:hypothetical protein